jgi:hypothetical protein
MCAMLGPIQRIPRAGLEQMSREVKLGLDWSVLYVRPSEYTRPEKNCTR